jgi:murein DD-endopeptidase MepM/ murein hydrolase activator NlpD
VKLFFMKMKLIILFASVGVMNACLSVSEKPRDSDLACTYHQVKPGDTLGKIAASSKVPIEEIMYVNGIDDQRALRVGQALFLPDPDPIGKRIAKLRPMPAKPSPSKKAQGPEKQAAATASAIFDFPVPGGVVIQDFSQNKKKPYDGIGIKAAKGSRINASLDGRVLFVGDDGTKFGLIVIVEHVDPYITVYAHLDKATVATGQKIKRGEQLGLVGQSGGVNVPHLHFQIRVAQRPKNPRTYLKM